MIRNKTVAASSYDKCVRHPLQTVGVEITRRMCKNEYECFCSGFVTLYPFAQFREKRLPCALCACNSNFDYGLKIHIAKE